MLSVEDGPAHRYLKSWGSHNPRPAAILVVSAHWENAGGPLVGLAEKPDTIHDFGGFPRELYEMKYPAHGSPVLAKQSVQLLNDAGFSARTSNTRGLDHGVWVPLSLMYPQADIPVFQVSLIRDGSTAEHYRMGVALQPLQEQGVLVIGSGSVTHNLGEVMGHGQDEPAPHWVSDFEDWLANTIEAGRVDDLINYRKMAPHAARNHPTEEHFLPLLVALGAGGSGAVACRVHASRTYGMLTMDAYTFS